MMQLDIEIARMSDIEAKSALKRLITTLSECMPCDFNDEIDTECPVKESCRKNSRPCDLAWLHFAKGDKNER